MNGRGGRRILIVLEGGNRVESVGACNGDGGLGSIGAEEAEGEGDGGGVVPVEGARSTSMVSITSGRLPASWAHSGRSM